jgi:hypothetical protein
MISIPIKTDGDFLYAEEINAIVDYINNLPEKYEKLINIPDPAPEYAQYDSIPMLNLQNELVDSGVSVNKNIEGDVKIQHYAANSYSSNHGIIISPVYSAIINGVDQYDHQGIIMIDMAGRIDINTGNSQEPISIVTESNLILQGSEEIVMTGGLGVRVDSPEFYMNNSDIIVGGFNITYPNIVEAPSGGVNLEEVSHILGILFSGNMVKIPATQVQNLINANIP